MKSLLIGLGAKAKIGKDFIAKELAKFYDVERIAFADTLKESVAKLLESNGLMDKLGMSYEELEQTPDLKEKIRPLLVALGSTMRAFDEAHWINQALGGKEFKHEITIVTDVRFPNEVKAIKDLSGYFINIKTDTEPANETEAGYAAVMAELADYTIINNFDSKFVLEMRSLIENLKAAQYV